MIHQNIQRNSAAWGDQPAHLVSWRSVAAGLLISLFTMTALVGLGMAFGGIGIDDDVTVKGASVFTGIWFLVSTVISLFVGSYYSARLSTYRIPAMGTANGLLIASLFILFFLFQAFSTIGMVGRGAGSLVESTSSGLTEITASNPQSTSVVASFVEEQFLELDLRSSPQIVASGVASRLLSGNIEGAKNYLGFQANIDAEEAQARIAQLNAQAKRLIDEAKVAAASALKTTGWSLFILIVLSTIAAVFGGYLGGRGTREVVAQTAPDRAGLFNKPREV